jgi:hypothetical protein
MVHRSSWRTALDRGVVQWEFIWPGSSSGIDIWYILFGAVKESDGVRCLGS